MTPAPTSIELFTARPERGAKNKICTTYNLRPSILIFPSPNFIICGRKYGFAAARMFGQIYASGSDYILRAADAPTYIYM